MRFPPAGACVRSTRRSSLSATFPLDLLALAALGLFVFTPRCPAAASAQREPPRTRAANPHRDSAWRLPPSSPSGTPSAPSACAARASSCASARRVVAAGLLLAAVLMQLVALMLCLQLPSRSTPRLGRRRSRRAAARRAVHAAARRRRRRRRRRRPLPRHRWCASRGASAASRRSRCSSRSSTGRSSVSRSAGRRARSASAPSAAASAAAATTTRSGGSWTANSEFRSPDASRVAGKFERLPPSLGSRLKL